MRKKCAPNYSNTLYIFREYIERGSVADILENKPIEEDMALKYFRQACQGLNYLHTNGVVHGGVRANNMLVTVRFDIKLSDYKFQTICEHTNSESQKQNILLHMAPELFVKNQSPNSKSDIWSLGCTLVHMLTQNIPLSDVFEGKTSDFIHESIKNNKFSKSGKNKIVFSSKKLIPYSNEDTKKFFDSIMKEDENNRPSAKEILKMPLMVENSKKFEHKNSFEDFFETHTRNRASTIDRRDSSSLNTPETIKLLPEELGLNFPYKTILKKRQIRVPDSDFIMAVKYFSIQAFVVITFLLKWIVLVAFAAVIMAFLATLIMTTIFVIYNGIQMSCQCDLSEGVVALIAIILLPILILLTTLCCNSAFENYQQAMGGEEIKNSCFYVAPPEKNLNLFGFKIIEGEKKPKRKLGHMSKWKKQEEEDMTSPALLSKGKLVNNIAELA